MISASKIASKCISFVKFKSFSQFWGKFRTVAFDIRQKRYVFYVEDEVLAVKMMRKRKGKVCFC